MEYKAGQEYKMKYIDKDQKEHEATYTPDKDTNIAGMINGFKDKTKDFFKLLSIDDKSLDESRKITEEKDSGLKDALDNDVELFDDIYLYLDEYIKDEDTKSEIEDIIDKYTGIGGSAEDLDEDSEEYKSELEDCINEIEDLLNLNESKKITESEDKPELADMLIEINRYYIDYIDNISFFIDLANVAGIDYDKVYDWYKSIKEDENDDLEESKKITESDGENDNRIIYVGYAEKAYWKGTLKDYMKDEGNIDSDIIAKAKEDGYDISAHDIEHYDKDPHKDSQKSNLEVTNIRLSGQTEGLVAKATVKTEIGNIELNLLKLDGNYKCVINGFEPTEDEKSIINKYGQEALTKAVVDVYNDKSKVTESEDKYTYDKDEEEKLRKIFKDLQDGYSYGYDMKNVSYPIFKKVLSIGKSFGQKDYGTNYINVNYYGGTSHKITLDNLKWIMDKIFNMTPSKFLSKFIRNDKSTIKD